MNRFAVLMGVVVIYVSGCSPSLPSPSTSQTAVATSSNQPSSDWQLDHSVNAMTGVETTIAYLKYKGDQNLYVRQIGKKLECYVTTTEFLETMENIESRVSTVQYRFDDGKVVKQGWEIGASNDDLFYPGNCAPFVSKLRSAKTLAIEFKPADKVEETLTFSVYGFPDQFKLAAPSTSQAAKASTHSPS